MQPDRYDWPMIDRLTVSNRSRNMQAIRSKDTAPECVVRSLAHRLGFRFRLHRKDLPGKPDLVFPRYKAVVFVHGCYWHGHGCKRGGTGAKSNQDYWGPKLERTKQRDRRNAAALENAGWRVLTLWECQLGDTAATEATLCSFLQAP